MENTIKKPLLTLLLIGFVSFFALGCGSSSDSSGGGVGFGDDLLNNNNGAPTARVIVQFTRAQAQTTVPASTTQADFVFFDNVEVGQGNQVFAAFNVPIPAGDSPSVQLEDVPATARSLRITVRDASGAPISVIAMNVALISGGTTTIDTSTGVASAVTFDGLIATPDPLLLDLNQESSTVQLVLTGSFSTLDTSEFSSQTFASAASFSSSDNTISVNQSGVVSVVDGEPTTATITASYTLGETTQTDTLTVRTGVLDTAGLMSSTTRGESSEAFTTINFFDGSLQSPTNVVGLTGLSFSLLPGGEGLTIDSATGVVTAANISSSTYTIVVTFDNGTREYTGTIDGVVSLN